MAATEAGESREWILGLRQDCGPGLARGPGVKAREQGAPAALPNNGNTADTATPRGREMSKGRGLEESRGGLTSKGGGNKSPRQIHPQKLPRSPGYHAKRSPRSPFLSVLATSPATVWQS